MPFTALFLLSLILADTAPAVPAPTNSSAPPSVAAPSTPAAPAPKKEAAAPAGATKVPDSGILWTTVPFEKGSATAFVVETIIALEKVVKDMNTLPQSET